jgi:hypothetical protein
MKLRVQRKNFQIVLDTYLKYSSNIGQGGFQEARSFKLNYNLIINIRLINNYFCKKHDYSTFNIDKYSISKKIIIFNHSLKILKPNISYVHHNLFISFLSLYYKYFDIIILILHLLIFFIIPHEINKQNLAYNIICLSEFENKNFLNTENQFNIKLWLEFSRKIKDLTGEDKVDMVFEHIGKETIALSLYLLRRGGRVVTCAATSGFIANIDLRYVWMEMKKLIGSHFCNPREAVESVTLLEKGYIKNSPSLIIDFNEIPKGLNLIDKRQAKGKIAIKF